MIHPAFYIPSGESPNFRLPESNIGFDAEKNIDFISPSFDDTKWPEARLLDLEKLGGMFWLTGRYRFGKIMD